jgi:hypothetical protein
MKNYFVLLFLLIGLISSCVSSKKFKELTEKNKICSEELEKYKRSSLDFESKFKDFKALYDVASADVLSMKKDTTILGDKYRKLFYDYQALSAENTALENSFTKYKSLGRRKQRLFKNNWNLNQSNYNGKLKNY